MSRYRYTIVLGVVLVVVAGLLVWRWNESRACSNGGGHYVREFPGGWACIR